MIVCDLPAEINGEQLTAELVEAGHPHAAVVVANHMVEVSGVQSAEANAVRAIVAAHVPAPVQPAPSKQQLVDAIVDAASDWKSAMKTLVGEGLV